MAIEKQGAISHYHIAPCFPCHRHCLFCILHIVIGTVISTAFNIRFLLLFTVCFLNDATQVAAVAILLSPPLPIIRRTTLPLHTGTNHTIVFLLVDSSPIARFLMYLQNTLMSLSQFSLFVLLY